MKYRMLLTALVILPLTVMAGDWGAAEYDDIDNGFFSSTPSKRYPNSQLVTYAYADLDCEPIILMLTKLTQNVPPSHHKNPVLQNMKVRVDGGEIREGTSRRVAENVENAGRYKSRIMEMLPDNNDIILEMLNGNTIIVLPDNGTNVTDEFSLEGFTQSSAEVYSNCKKLRKSSDDWEPKERQQKRSTDGEWTT